MTEPTSCLNCDAWGSATLCAPCRGWVAKYPVGRCSNCGHTLPMKVDLCRACRVHQHWFGPGVPVQLWFGGHLALSTGAPSPSTGYVPLPAGRPARRRLQAQGRAARFRPVSKHIVHAGQLSLFFVERDWAQLDLRTLPSLTPKAAELVAAFERHGRASGWLDSTVGQASRPLRTLVSWTGAEARIDAREVAALVRDLGLTCGGRVCDFLDMHGMLVPAPPKGDPHRAAVERMIEATAAVFRSDVQRWVQVLRGKGRRRHRTMQWITIRKYLSYLRPILAAWSSHITSLREVADDDVKAAVHAVTGTTAQDRHVALRSLFGALKQERVIFRDPTLGLRLPGHQRPPASLPTGTLPTLFGKARTSIARAITTLIAVHAITPTTVRMLRTDQVDLASGRITFGSRRVALDEFTHRVLTEWLRERHQRWPRTANPHLLLSSQTAADVRNPPITAAHLHRLLAQVDVNATQLRVDRVLDEARHTADPVALMNLFGLSANTAMNYVTAAHPDQGINIRK